MPSPASYHIGMKMAYDAPVNRPALRRRRRVPRPRSRARGGFPRPPRLGVRAKLWITLGPRTLFGDGKAELLGHVDSLGSLRRAALRMGMSYRYAWGLLRELERAAGFAFLARGAGKARARLRLTDEGRAFVAAYRSFRAPLEALAVRRFKRIFRSR